MKRKVSKKKLVTWLERKSIFLLLIVVIIMLFNSVVRDWISIGKNILLKQDLEEEYASLQNEQTVLEQEVAKLQDQEYVLRYAREKYGYSKDGELIIRINEDK